MRTHTTPAVMRTAIITWLVVSGVLGLVYMSLTNIGAGSGADPTVWTALWIYNVLILVVILAIYVCIDDDDGRNNDKPDVESKN